MDNRPSFMYSSIDELLAQPTGRPWFMTASIGTLLADRDDKEE
jgi:hypothetical protein